MRRGGSTVVRAALAAAIALAPTLLDAQRYFGGPPPGYGRGPGGPGPRFYGRPPGGFYPRGEGFYRRGPGGPPRRFYGRPHRCRNDGAGDRAEDGAAGGLLGNSIAGRGDRTTGTILGGGAGALAGRAIDRDC